MDCEECQIITNIMIDFIKDLDRRLHLLEEREMQRFLYKMETTTNMLNRLIGKE
jgi:hypothetical protein